MDKQCYDIAKNAFNILYIVAGSDTLTAKKLFMTPHSRGYQASQRMNIDDIAEAELAPVINSIQSLAFSGKIDINSDFLSSTTGNIKGNLIDELQKLMNDTNYLELKQLIEKIQNINYRNKAYKKLVAKLKDIQAKSIKTDVKSFLQN